MRQLGPLSNAARGSNSLRNYFEVAGTAAAILFISLCNYVRQGIRIVLYPAQVPGDHAVPMCNAGGSA